MSPPSAPPGAVRTELLAFPVADDIVLDGAAWIPAAGASDTAIALFPGTGAQFTHPWLAWLGPRLAARGYLVAAVNRRDHGQFFGRFTLAEAAADHRHAIDYLIGRGARQVVLGGHSYGTVTAPYYVRETGDARVAGLILYAALGDLRAGTVAMVGGRTEYDRIVAEARRMVAAGRGDETFLIPPVVPGQWPLPHSWAVFLDKRGPDSQAVPAEIIRDLGERPLLAVRDPADPYPATLPPAQARLEAASANLAYVLLDDLRAGATDEAAHRFAGREEEVLAITLAWLDTHDLSP